jgi:Phosphodiester glycosidase
MSIEKGRLRVAARCSGSVIFRFLVLALAWSTTAFGAAKPERYLSYTNEIVSQMPWSIHVVRVDRAHHDLRFSTTLGGGAVLGMGNLTDQLKTLPAELGTPLAAINGDFYEKAKDYPGRPRDLQIRNGEVISHPAGHACFWIDAQGNPQMTNILSRFRVVWPNGKETPFGLNVQRTNDAAVLYTAVLGASTHTSGGVEYVLERSPQGEWLPLRVGQTYEARVRQVQTVGDTRLDRQTVVLSIEPGLVSRVSPLSPGATVRLIMETTPDLSGAEVAIGGGPTLIKDGKLMSWKDWLNMRHPRTALGWNQQHIFLVEVDGRQIDVSLGMTFLELAEYMLKLGCEQAMNLDGGGSATLWALGAVRSSPSEGQERPSPNALVVVRKNPRQAAK